MLAYSLISDMHVNHPQMKTPYDSLEQIVVVAGDTDNGLGGMKFLQKLRNKGHVVVAVDGNHEHYSNASQGRTIEETTARFKAEYPDTVEIDDVLFVQRNGWYLVGSEPDWAAYMNDMRFSGSSQDVVNGRAYGDATFIRQSLASARERGQKVVVTTHTAPCTDTLNPAYADHFSNEWYYNPLMTPLLSEFSETILVWNHGHTHAPADKIVHGTRVVCNPRGYPGEQPRWAPKRIEV